MNALIGVRCPFTGNEELPVPSGMEWAGKVPNEKWTIWYFSHEEVADEGLSDCVSHLLDEEMDPHKVNTCIEALTSRGDLQRVGDWWFLKLPKLPAFKLPNIADFVIAQETQTDIVGATRARFETYAKELEEALHQ